MTALPRVSLALAALALVAAAARPAAGGTSGTTYYTCTVNISAGTHDCTEGKITVTTSSGSQRVLRVDLSTNSPAFVRLDAFVDVSSPTAYWIHFADSPTCNAFGGDSGTAIHDAEAYILGRRFDAYGMDPTSQPIMSSQDVVPASGGYRVQWSILKDRVLFDDDGDPADAPRLEVTSTRHFEIAPYPANEPDSEDSTGADANKWYVGLNRTVGLASRSGTGVTKACFVLSTTTAPSAATLASLCPTGAAGGGGKDPIPVDPT